MDTDRLTPSDDNRSLIPLPARHLIPARRLLPVPRKVAIGLTAGAVGTFFVKRLVELAAEDLYQRIKRATIARPKPETINDPPPRPLPASPADNEPPPDTVWLRVVHVRWLRRPGHPRRYRARTDWIIRNAVDIDSPRFED
jgi:hypothetical protein